MSSICDGWQPIEAKYKLSRSCLKILLEASFSPDILTKSSLILRDFDLLQAYKTPRLGMTLTTLNYKLYKALEPYASSPNDRLETLKKAQNQGIRRYLFLGPLIPELTDSKENLESIFEAIKGLDLDEIYVDKLNLRFGVLESLKRGLVGRLEPLRLRSLLYKVKNPANHANLRDQVHKLAHQFNLSKITTICF
jgi:DNA repair photolyase